MKKKMLINATDEEEIRVAIVEDGLLQELDVQAAGKEQLRGNIYKARVVNIEEGLQAAFVDFSGGRPGFLALSEIQPSYWRQEVSRGGRRRIENLLKKGQELLVQVTKDEIGGKGAALTTYVSLPGRYLVLMPGSDSTGISRKIEDEEKRRRLKEIMAQLDIPPDMGLIVRTAGLDRTKSELAKDLSYLLKLWETIRQKADSVEAPALIYQDLNVITRAIRDYFTTDIEEVLIDNPEVYKEAKAFFSDVMPRYVRRVKLYSDRKPLFTKYELERQIETIYERKVPLKGGGSIIIEPTEALVSIDVNSGRGATRKGIEETSYQTNLEAAREIARQLRLRDLGGLIVIDFIDMKDRKHKTAVEREFRAAAKRDKARIQASPISRFGLMEVSRQRLRSPLMDVTYRPCPSCQGQGLVKSTEALSITILRKIQEAAARGTVKEIHGIMAVSVAEYLLNKKRKEILQIESEHDVKILLSGTSEIPAGQYELEFLRREPPEEERPSRARRRRGRRQGDMEAPSEAELQEDRPAEEEVSSEAEARESPSLLDTGLRLVRRLSPFARWRAEQEEDFREPVEEEAEEPQAVAVAESSSHEEAPSTAETQGRPRRRRSRSRGARRRTRRPASAKAGRGASGGKAPEGSNGQTG